MGKPYRECPRCGAHLDAGEICDCGKKRQDGAAQPREKMKLIAICREVDPEKPRIPIFHPCFCPVGAVRGRDSVHSETADGNSRRRGQNRRD